MKKNLLFTICLGLFCVATQAQDRYLDEIFTKVDVTTDVKYGENYTVITGSPVLKDLLLDVYQPNGDTESSRPLIILAHAGSFLPKGNNTLPLGVKEDSCMIEMCTQFAKRGWVAVSMDYRLGWNPVSSDADVRAGTIMNAVYRATQDMKACVRYFKKEATTYKIDTTRITVGGSNSGGYMAMTYTTLQDSNELKLLKFTNSGTGKVYIDQNVTGDINGKGGATGVNIYNHPGHSSDVQLALNLGGAIADTSWQEAGEVPIVAFHGVQDALTPYKTGVVIVAATQQSVVEVSGSHDLARYNEALNNQNFHDQFFSDPFTMAARAKTSISGLFPFPGAANGFEPWGWYDPNDPNAQGAGGSAANPAANPTKGRAYIDTIMGFFCPRAVQVLKLPGNTVGIEKLTAKTGINVFPNPSTDQFNIASANIINSISISDITGKVVYEENNINSTKYKFNRTVNMYKGIYLLTVNTAVETTTKRIVFE